MELDLQLEDTTSAAEDEERDRVREDYRRRLAEKLKDPEFRKIEGFPVGTDEAILALSDPPYYTACPNPFLEEWLYKNVNLYTPETDDYHREPFAADVSEGKTDPIYNAHSYHTKVPHKAIMRYILHFTEPGDIVYDGFCGTGMTGIAAQLCDDVTQITSLGYRVSAEGKVIGENGKDISVVGARRAVLNDISPAATFVAANYNIPFNIESFVTTANTLLERLKADLGWMYETIHPETGAKVIFNYVVWSEVFDCHVCGRDIVFTDVAYDNKTGKVLESFLCPHCAAVCSKADLKLQYETIYDENVGEVIQIPKRTPILINYSIGNRKYEKRPDEHDFAILEKLKTLPYAKTVPTIKLPNMQMARVGRMQPAKITHLHHFFLDRQRQALGSMWSKVSELTDKRIRAELYWFIEQAIWGMSVLNRYQPIQQGRLGGSQVNRQLSGVFYVASHISEVSPWYNLIGKLKRLTKAFNGISFNHGNTITTTGDCGSTPIADETVDYIFTDPPFGENIYYSDLNLLVESWHKVITNTEPEAIIDRARGKKLPEYQELMTNCFRKYYQVLKPGRWMTVEFHNSQNSVWNSIQEALQHAGFIVADVRTLNKQQGSFQQVSSVSAVKSDLVISCYKPRHQFEERFKLVQGKPEGVIDFIRQHLEMLPVVPISKDGKIEVVVERTKYLLFDRMIAYHLQQGARIPMSATEFYEMLDREFSPIDEMHFLPDQRARYDAVRARTEVEQPELYISDERSAVHWVRRQLAKQSVTLGELVPAFMQELHNWPSHEPRPELRDILKVNFITDEDGKWRVPDPSQERDLEALRRKALLKTFEGYVKSKGQLKVFRKEAILEGFKQCWQTKQYGVIVAVCESIPAKILQEVPEFVQFYDIAKDLAPAETVQLEFTWEG